MTFSELKPWRDGGGPDARGALPKTIRVTPAMFVLTRHALRCNTSRAHARRAARRSWWLGGAGGGLIFFPRISRSVGISSWSTTFAGRHRSRWWRTCAVAILRRDSNASSAQSILGDISGIISCGNGIVTVMVVDRTWTVW